MLKELMETMHKELKKTGRIMYEQIKNTNKVIEVMKRNQRIIELKGAITEILNPLQIMNSIFDQAEESGH